MVQVIKAGDYQELGWNFLDLDSLNGLGEVQIWH